MSIELTCARCEGRFLAESPATVACPHCGRHVSVPVELFFTSAETVGDSVSSRENDPEENAVEEARPGTHAALEPPFPSFAAITADSDHAEAAAEAEPSAPVAREVPGDGGPASEAEAREKFSESQQGPEACPDGQRQSNQHYPKGQPEGDEVSTPEESVEHVDKAEASPGSDVPTEPLVEPPDDSAADSPHEARSPFPGSGEPRDSAPSAPLPTNAGNTPPDVTAAGPAKPAAGPSTGGGRRSGLPVAWFIVLAGYASAVTILCVWLFMQLLYGSHRLESLQDPAEAPSDGKRKAVRLYPVDLEMPFAHRLKLGESRRFGNILMEPIKVTRGPLQFVHFSDEEVRPRSATEPVLKLWLRFQNVSTDQTIAPLDKTLLFTNRVRSKDDYDRFRSNVFVCRKDDKTPSGHQVHVYDLNTDDIWDLKGQQLGRELKPGESLVTYIPTSENGIERLTGVLVWRVHLRKGYSPSGNGVTTLVEVEFHSRSIQDEDEPAPGGTSATAAS